MKRIIKEGCSIESYKNDGTMSFKLPDKLKKFIINYLNTPEAGWIGDCPMIDPVTGECYTRTNIMREADGFQWSSGGIYMFEKYDIKLSDEFLELMKLKFKEFSIN